MISPGPQSVGVSKEHSNHSLILIAEKSNIELPCTVAHDYIHYIWWMCVSVYVWLLWVALLHAQTVPMGGSWRGDPVAEPLRLQNHQFHWGFYTCVSPLQNFVIVIESFSIFLSFFFFFLVYHSVISVGMKLLLLFCSF